MLLTSAIAVLLVAPQADVFDQLDKNADGQIDQTELPKNSGLVRRVLLGKDANGDGVITRDEFLGKTIPAGTPTPPKSPARPMNREEPKPPPAPVSAFDRLDRNGNGVVELEELPETQRPYFAALFGGRKRLSREEFSQILKQPVKKPARASKAQPLFAMLDQDSNGVVSRDEIDKALADPKMIKASGLDAEIFQSALRDSKQTEFSETQLTQLLMPIIFGRELTKYDRNNDGLIELDEVPPNYRGSVSRLLKFGDLPERAPVAIEVYVDLFKKAREAAVQGMTAPPKKLDNVPAAFKLLDENRDGIITPEELQDVTARLGRLDRNGDGGLSLEEFLGNPAVSSATKPAGDTARTEPAKSEPSGPPRVKPDGIEKFVKTFFSQFDKDSNGKLTKQEAPASMLQRFDSMDIDQDGAVSRAEMAEALITARKPKDAP